MQVDLRQSSNESRLIPPLGLRSTAGPGSALHLAKYLLDEQLQVTRTRKMNLGKSCSAAMSRTAERPVNCEASVLCRVVRGDGMKVPLQMRRVWVQWVVVVLAKW